MQPGPAELFSLRASLICLEQHITLIPRKGGSSGVTRTDREVKEKMIHTQNLVDEDGLRVFAGEIWRRTVEFTVPADGLASKETEKHVILWRIEVWGKGRFFASFMHPYNVQVIEKKNNGTAELGK